MNIQQMRELLLATPPKDPRSRLQSELEVSEESKGVAEFLDLIVSESPEFKGRKRAASIVLLGYKPKCVICGGV